MCIFSAYFCIFSQTTGSCPKLIEQNEGGVDICVNFQLISVIFSQAPGSSPKLGEQEELKEDKRDEERNILKVEEEKEKQMAEGEEITSNTPE